MVKKVTRQNWFIENKWTWCALLCGIIIGVLVMGIMWPKQIATLKDGTEPVVKINDELITANDLYNELKSNSGLTALLNMIDKKILDDMYQDIDTEALEYAQSQSDYYYGIYESYYGYTKEQFLSENGFKDEDAFITYLKEDFAVQKYYDEYVKKLITDKDVQKYYDEEVFGEKYLYVFSGENSEDLEKVRQELKKGKTYEEITKKYKSINGTVIGKTSFKDVLEYSEDFVKQLKKIKKNSYSKVFETDEYKQTVIYVTDVADKPKLDDIKEDIITLIMDNMKKANEKLYYQAFIELREEYKISFSDTELQKEYDKYKKQYK